MTQIEKPPILSDEEVRRRLFKGNQAYISEYGQRKVQRDDTFRETLKMVIDKLRIDGIGNSKVWVISNEDLTALNQLAGGK